MDLIFNSVVHVAGSVDGRGQLTDLHLEALLDVVKHLLVLLGFHEGDREALGSEAARAAHAVEVAVAVVRHVEVEHDVDFLNVDTASEDFRSNQDAVLELLEALVDLDPAHTWPN